MKAGGFLCECSGLECELIFDDDDEWTKLQKYLDTKYKDGKAFIIHTLCPNLENEPVVEFYKERYVICHPTWFKDKGNKK